MRSKRLKYLLQGSIIAALYVALTVLFSGISYGVVQVRIAEALTVLPFFTPAAIPGLFVGCALANMIGGYGLLDVVVGSLATLFAAFMTYRIKNRWLAPLPSVLLNGVMVGLMLAYVLELPAFVTMGQIALEQAVACYGLGLPLLLLLNRYGRRIFPSKDV